MNIRHLYFDFKLKQMNGQVYFKQGHIAQKLQRPQTNEFDLE